MGFKASTADVTVGFLIDHTESQYQFGILQGISDFAQHRNINLICFEGGLLIPDADGNLKSERNILYELATKKRLDGLIILSDSLGIHLDDDALFQFRERFHSLPVIFVGRSHPKVPSIIVDTFYGMREMVLHLIEKHKYRSFGFIKGLSGSYHAEMRYSAFKEVLSEYEIPIDEDLIYDGDFLDNSGILAIRHMLNTEKMPDVIVSCNDEMAISALHELERQGLRVPEDVAVVGVDDIPKCATTRPPMTTVRQPLQREGWKAMSLLMKILDGSVSKDDDFPLLHTLDSRLIIRESCGCNITNGLSKPTISSEQGDGQIRINPVSLEQHRKQIVPLLQSISYEHHLKDEDKMAGELVIAFLQAGQTRNTDIFLDLWRNFLNINLHLEVDEVIICGLLQHLRNCANECNFPPLIGDHLFWAAMSMLEKRTLKLIRKTYNNSMREEFILNQLRDQLDMRFGQEKNLDILYHNLVELGIKSAYMSLYDQSGNTSIARIILAYSDETRFPLPNEGLAFPSEHLIPDSFFNVHKRFSFMVEALNYDEKQIGFLILDMSNHINSIHTGIRRIINNLYRSIDLVNAIQYQQTELISTIEKLKETLEGIIKTLSITVANRDPYTAGHQRRVAGMSMAIGKELGLDENQLQEIRVAALLHDIGKIFIPAEILNKPGTLKPIEFELIKLHAEEGYNTLKNIEFPWPIAEIVFQHHERCDGSGYPRGLTRDQILPAARILAVADVIEAITSMRPYRAALGIEVAIEEITRYKGFKYDTEVVNAALKLIQSESLEITES
jgi:putative nucleotidyltransferase with HDIG domain